MPHLFQGKKSCQRFTAVLALTAGLTLPARTLGQERIDPMAVTVGQRFMMIEQTFIALAGAMPAEQYGFKPTYHLVSGGVSLGPGYIHDRAQFCQRGGNLEVRVWGQPLRVPAAMKAPRAMVAHGHLSPS